MTKFAHMYRLTTDLPGYKAGRRVRWDGGRQRFYFYKLTEKGYDKGEESIYADFEGMSFTLEQVQEDGWFKTEGELRDFIPAFPARAALTEFVDLVPDCRLVDDVDECRAINGLLASDAFQERLYGFFRKEYNEFYGLESV
jgi:hypothetical protein